MSASYEQNGRVVSVVNPGADARHLRPDELREHRAEMHIRDGHVFAPAIRGASHTYPELQTHADTLERALEVAERLETARDDAQAESSRAAKARNTLEQRAIRDGQSPNESQEVADARSRVQAAAEALSDAQRYREDAAKAVSEALGRAKRAHKKTMHENAEELTMDALLRLDEARERAIAKAEEAAKALAAVHSAVGTVQMRAGFNPDMPIAQLIRTQYDHHSQKRGSTRPPMATLCSELRDVDIRISYGSTTGMAFPPSLGPSLGRAVRVAKGEEEMPD